MRTTPELLFSRIHAEKARDTTTLNDKANYNVIECCNNIHQGAPRTGKQTTHIAIPIGPLLGPHYGPVWAGYLHGECLRFGNRRRQSRYLFQNFKDQIAYIAFATQNK